MGVKSAAAEVGSKVYRPRSPEASPFYKLVTTHFDDFERIFAEQYQPRYGFWRPVVRTSMDKFLKCGDLREGFARVRCPDCGEEFFVAFSCRQRGCCPSCDQKRALLLGLRLSGEIMAPVPHRQWVFTLPKRLRVYFNRDHRLLGRLSRISADVIFKAFHRETGDDGLFPGIVAAIQTFGDLVNWHPHVHAMVTEGVFTDIGHFIRIPQVDMAGCLSLWRERIFDLLLRTEKIGPEVVYNMKTWKHSGFSIDTSVRLEAGDNAGIRRLAEYIGRCPISLARIISLNRDGKVVYRAVKNDTLPYPVNGQTELIPGIPRNFQIFEPMDFLAEVTQHIPNKGEHQVRYYGWYSNKKRGLKRKGEKAAAETQARSQQKRRMAWAALIRMVYEVDPLRCPKCGGTMKIISFIQQDEVIRRILTHCGLWKDPPERPPPRPAPTISPPAPAADVDVMPDYSLPDDIYDQE